MANIARVNLRPSRKSKSVMSAPSIAALAVAATVAAGAITGLTIGSTTISSTIAARIDRSVERVAYPEDFVASTTDGGTAFTLPDGGPVVGVDGGALPSSYPYNGQVDWTAAIQAAANSLASTCGAVRLRDDRLYYVSGLVTLPACVGIEGNARPLKMNDSPISIDGSGSGLVIARANAVSFLKLNHGGFVRRVNFGLRPGTTTPSAGKAIDLSGAYGIEISDVTINGCWDGIYSVNAGLVGQHITMRDVNILHFANIGMVLEKVVDLRWEGGTIMNWGTPWATTGKGTTINGGATMFFSKLLYQSSSEGVRSLGEAVQDIHWTDCTFDGLAVIAMSLKHVKQSTIIGCHFNSNTQYGVWLNDYTSGVTLANNNFIGTGLQSIVVQGATVPTSVTQTTITHNHFYFLSGNAVHVAANTTDFVVSGNTLSRYEPDTQGGPSGGDWHVFVDTGTSDRYVITYNVGAGESGIVSDGGSGVAKTVSGNH